MEILICKVRDVIRADLLRALECVRVVVEHCLPSRSVDLLLPGCDEIKVVQQVEDSSVYRNVSMVMRVLDSRLDQVFLAPIYKESLFLREVYIVHQIIYILQLVQPLGGVQNVDGEL